MNAPETLLPEALARSLPVAALTPPPRSSAAATVIATLAVIAALGWGQLFLVPLTAGLMLAMLVLPLALWLERWLRSRAAAAVLTLLLVLTLLAAGALAFGGQLLRVAERVPEMISTVAQQIAHHDPGADPLLTRARSALQQLDRAADVAIAAKPLVRPGRRGAPSAAAGPASAAAPNNNITDGATEVLRDTAVGGSGVALAFAGHLSIIFFVAFFVLTGGKALAEGFLGLWGYHAQAHDRARRALVECARQIRLYAGVLLVTNAALGITVWAAFAAIDLPDAVGWGVTAAVLHVVPYLGMAVLATLGAAEAFLAYETLGAALGMAGFLVLLSTLLGTLVSSWLQGRAAKMNPAAVFIGLVFWGALWGVWGLFLGPPLIVLFKVVLEHSRSGQRLARLMRG
jgi:predicted PurR-regulated permease PerM